MSLFTEVKISLAKTINSPFCIKDDGHARSKNPAKLKEIPLGFRSSSTTERLIPIVNPTQFEMNFSPRIFHAFQEDR